MTQPQQPTMADRVIADLEQQLSEPDPRYARKCKELAILRQQFAELSSYVEQHADVLGLEIVDGVGTPVPQASESDVPADSEPEKKVNGAKVDVPSAKT